MCVNYIAMSSRKLRTDTYANMYRLLKDINSLKKDVENLKKIKADDDNFSSLFAARKLSKQK